MRRLRDRRRDHPRFPDHHTAAPGKAGVQNAQGLHCDIRGIRDFAALPAEARAYVEFIEQEIGHHINMVSNGPEREAIIIR